MKVSRHVKVAIWLLVAVVGIPAVAEGAQRAPARDRNEWVGSWSTALTGAETLGVSHNGFDNQSVRMPVHLSVGGSQIRVRLANPYGTSSLVIGRATVAKPDTTTPELHDVDPSTMHELRFDGLQSATMLQGQELMSDPVALAVDAGTDLIVTLFFPAPTGPVSWHSTSRQSTYSGPGDLSTDAAGAGFTVQRSCCWFFLSGVDVLRNAGKGSVVVLGDSISDGTGSTLNANTRWPDLLADRLAQAPGPHAGGVLNASLAGNRLLHEGVEPGAGGFPGFVQLGPNAGARLAEDVFSQIGARTVVLQLGLQDIWMNGDSAADIIGALRQITSQLRARGLGVVVATITPYEGFSVIPGSPAGEWTPEKEAIRNEVNDYLRTSSEFDAVADFDLVLRDPASPSGLAPIYDSGDHMHPNDAGAAAIAAAVPRL